MTIRLDPDLLLALDERARAAKLQPCGRTTMARALLRQVLGLSPDPLRAVEDLPATTAPEIPPARARTLAFTARCPICDLLTTQCRGHRRPEPEPESW